MRNPFSRKSRLHPDHNVIMREFVARKAQRILDLNHLNDAVGTFATLDLKPFAQAVEQAHVHNSFGHLPAEYYKTLKSVLLFRMRLKSLAAHHHLAREAYNVFFGQGFGNYAINLKGALSHLDKKGLEQYISSISNSPSYGLMQIMLDKLMVEVAQKQGINPEKCHELMVAFEHREHSLVHYASTHFHQNISSESAEKHAKKKAGHIHKNMERLHHLFGSVHSRAIHFNNELLGHIAGVFHTNIHDLTTGVYKSMRKMQSAVMVMRLASVALVLIVPSIAMAAMPSSELGDMVDSMQDGNLIDSLSDHYLTEMMDHENFNDVVRVMEDHAESLRGNNFVSEISELSGASPSAVERAVDDLLVDAVIAQGVDPEKSDLFDVYTQVDIVGLMEQDGQHHSHFKVHFSDVPDNLVGFHKQDLNQIHDGHDYVRNTNNVVQLTSTMSHNLRANISSEELAGVRHFEMNGHHGVMLVYTKVEKSTHVIQGLIGQDQTRDVVATIYKIIMVNGD